MDLKCLKPNDMIFAFLLILPMTCAVRIKVKECPVTETAWMARSQIFTCESTQVYHCFQDEKGNLMETCMVAYKVKPYEEGGCPWAFYSTERGAILGGVFHICEGIGCPQKNDSDYLTNEIYKYPICLRYNETTEVTNATIYLSYATERTRIGNAMNKTKDVVIIGITTTTAAIIVAFLVIVVIWRYRRLNMVCSKNAEMEGSTNAVMEEDNIHKLKLSLQDKDTVKGMKWNSSKKSELSKAVDDDGRTVLHHACLAGNTSLVISLLDICIDLLHIKDNDGCTPFHLAGCSGSVKLVKILIGKGCNIRSKDNTGQTIVHYACQAGHISLVKYMIHIDKDNNSMMLLHSIDNDGQTIVHHACINGHLNLVILFMRIEKGVFNVKNIHGLTPFHFAGFSGSVELVQYLIDNGCDVYSKDNTGRTILHIACQEGHIQLVEYLIGIDKNMLHMKNKNGMTPYQCKDKHGWTILYNACSNGCVELVKLVTEVDKDRIDERDKLGLTPFHVAGYSGSVELLQLLLDNGCDIFSKNSNGQTIVHLAFELGHISLAKFLIRLDKRVLTIVDNNGCTPFHCAGLSGSVELVQFLIDNGCDVYSKDNDGRTIAHNACQEGHVSLVKDLINRGIGILNTDNNELTPFHCAGLSGSVELVKYLIYKGCNVYREDSIGRTIVHYACGKGHVNLVKYLADRDKGVLKIKDKNGWTPCYCAGFSGSVELVQYLIDNGCDVYSKDNAGGTIVHIACKIGHVDLVKHLLDTDKVVLDIKDNNGLTPFHYAGFSGSVELVQYLIDNGCDVYSKDNGGQTIVHIACQEGHVDMVKHLLDTDKAVLNIKDSNGLTPFHYAGSSGSVELVQYLNGYGCDVYGKDNTGQTIVHI